jgi:integrase
LAVRPAGRRWAASGVFQEDLDSGAGGLRRLRAPAAGRFRARGAPALDSPGDRLGLFLRLAVVLGARRRELCALRWQHVDLDRGEVLLERGVVYVSGLPLIDKATKTRSKRRLALDAGTVKLLCAEQAARELGFTLPASAYVFTREPDGSRPIHPSLATHQFAHHLRLGDHPPRQTRPPPHQRPSRPW